MGVPCFSVAVWDKDGVAGLLRIQHESIQSHEQVRDLVKEELPDEVVILVSVN